jgi:hypothetical protein
MAGAAGGADFIKGAVVDLAKAGGAEADFVAAATGILTWTPSACALSITFFLQSF